MLNDSDLKESFALVTGASDGLGREFAFQLAALGMNLVLVARNETKLNETATQLRAASGRKVLVVPADLTDLRQLAAIKKTLRENSVRIKVLVNNAGSGAWGRFEQSTPETYSKMIDLNLKAPVLLAQLFFDDLSSFKKSAIINVSSLAAVQPVPFMSLYAATKSSLTHFGLALWSEWQKYGIFVQTLMPGAIETKFDEKSGGFKAPFRKDKVTDIVKLSLTDLMTAGNAIVYAKGSFSQRLFAKILPVSFLAREVAKVFNPDKREP